MAFEQVVADMPGDNSLIITYSFQIGVTVFCCNFVGYMEKLAGVNVI